MNLPPPPVLVLGVGNPSRGDDALGPLFVARAEDALAVEVRDRHVEFLTDFQLQVEHALDLVGRTKVIFVDASITASPPFEFTRVHPAHEQTVSTHAMSPAAVLEAHQKVMGPPPPAFVLAIRGERFELGDPLSPAAASHLDAAVAFFLKHKDDPIKPAR